MAIRYGQQDYIIIQTAPGKRALVIVEKVLKGEGQGILENTRVTGDDTLVDFEDHQVMANLGPNPHVCTVMKVRVEPWFKSFDHSMGQVDFYYQPGKEFKEDLERNLDECEEAWTELNCENLWPMQWEIREPKSKKNVHGWYHPGRGRDDLDIVAIHTFKEHNDTLAHLLHHEFAHAIWQHKFKDKHRASWIRAYVAHAEVTRVTAKKSAELFESWMEYEGASSAWLLDQDEEDQAYFQAIMDQIHSNFKLRLIDVEILRTVADQSTLEHIWPEAVDSGEVSDLVTKYAEKNAEENWCENFAVYMNGKTLPESTSDLMQRTLKYLKGL